MKSLSIAAVLVGMTTAAPGARADQELMWGSDTMLEPMREAVIKAGMAEEIDYNGSGSAIGEAQLISGEQGIAPMSRLVSNAGLANLQNQGVDVIQTVIGLDGISLYVNVANSVTSIDIPTIRSVFTCEITDWRDIPGSNNTGPIAVYARDGLSGTTDVFKLLVGIPAARTFGNCVTIVNSASSVASHTSTETNAIGFEGLQALTDFGNKRLAVAPTRGGVAVEANRDTIRNFSYPLSRRLYITSVSGARFPSQTEQTFLDFLLDRTFLDPILVNNNFITCAATGCP